MTHDEILLTSLGATLLASAGVAAYLDRPMGRLLLVGCGGRVAARFWTACARVLLVAVPLTLQLLVCPAARAATPPAAEWLPEVIDQAKWGLLGLVGAVVVVGIGVGVVAGSRHLPVWVDPDEADDLRRLVDRVRVARARELLEKDGG